MAISAVSSNESFSPVSSGRDAPAARGKTDAVSGQQNSRTEDEKRQIEQLKRRDTEVKTHEEAHVSAGGQYVRGGVSYEYQTGPDGKKYAVGGEVSIDASPVSGNPKATITKMQVVKRAALAPAQPSGQDMAVAAQATKEEANAQAELQKQPAVADSAGKNKPAAQESTADHGRINAKQIADTYAKNSTFLANFLHTEAGPSTIDLAG
jgi:hypothetical protein